MSGNQRASVPQYFVGDDDKEAMAGQLLAQTLFAIDRLATVPEAPFADDFVDVLARAAAAMLAADTNLKTPGKRRAAAETVAVHVFRHLTRYRAEEEDTGVSALDRMLGSHQIPDELKNSWNNS